MAVTSYEFIPHSPTTTVPPQTIIFFVFILLCLSVYNIHFLKRGEMTCIVGAIKSYMAKKGGWLDFS
jgi:hypothetical protein